LVLITIALIQALVPFVLVCEFRDEFAYATLENALITTGLIGREPEQAHGSATPATRRRLYVG